MTASCCSVRRFFATPVCMAPPAPVTSTSRILPATRVARLSRSVGRTSGCGCVWTPVSNTTRSRRDGGWPPRSSSFAGPIRWRCIPSSDGSVSLAPGSSSSSGTRCRAPGSGPRPWRSPVRTGGGCCRACSGPRRRGSPRREQASDGRGSVYGAAAYTCPMHPEVVSEEPGRCPSCGMKLMAVTPTYMCPMHPEVVSEEPGHCPSCGMKLLPSHIAQAGAHHDHEHGEHANGDDHENGHAHAHDHAATDGIEWEDDMVEVNKITTPANTRWKLIDRSTEAANHDIAWQFRVGDRVKIRLVNEMDSDHPMHHPFHIHGAGRFLVLARDGEVEPNLVWSDTVLVRTGETVDILLEVTNPGRWMAHCHIAEHHESGMMFSFDVAEGEPAS